MSDRLSELEKRKKQLEDLKKKRDQIKANELSSLKETNYTSKEASNDESIDLSLKYDPSNNNSISNVIDEDGKMDHSLTRILKDIEAKSFKNASTTFANNKLNFSKDINFLNKREFGNIDKANISSLSSLKYTMSQISSMAIIPKEKIIYSKVTQTVDKTENLADYEIDEEATTSKRARRGSKTAINRFASNNKVDTKYDTDQYSAISSATGTLERKKIPQQFEIDAVFLTEDEASTIFEKKRFIEFFDSATKLIERAMHRETDICYDYSYNINTSVEQKVGSHDLNVHRTFFNDSYSQNRTVTCLDWSTLHPDLILSSYTPNYNKMSDQLFYKNPGVDSINLVSDGIVNVWNTRFVSEQNVPEYTFHIQSPVSSCCFSPFNQSLVIGGTYSGMIVIWDNRTSKRMPVQRSSLSTKSHTFPVCASKIIGISSSNSLVSLSSDGRICTWSLDMLNSPSETLDLYHKKSRSIMASCISFVHGQSNNCIVGCEEGSIYTVQRTGSKSGISSTYDAHFGPVTAVNYNPHADNKHIKDLFLSASMDWSIKLWSNRNLEPLHIFEEYNDFITDVQWSPINPSVFACSEGTGRLDIWNLSNSIEEPSASVVKEDMIINKLTWSPSGRHIAVGDMDGRVSIYSTESFNHFNNDSLDKFLSQISDLESKLSANQTKSKKNILGSRISNLNTSRPYMKI